MSKNMIDYVKEYGSQSFTEVGLTEVDSLILCQIIYFKLDGFVPGIEENQPSVTLQELYDQGDFDRLLAEDWYQENNRKLLDAMNGTVRFGSLKLNNYVTILNPENETQFAAVTFILDDKSVYIAYRGTDETMVGWKEDFNMAFSQPVHSQLLSVDYMVTAADHFAGDFYVGGHSKGGNLAVYAAMNCREDIRNRIIGIYNNDGPGFRPEIIEAGHYETIAAKTKKYIPRSSLVGMVLETDVDIAVVESSNFSVFQHNPYSWQIEGREFVRGKDMRASKRRRDDALNKWILSRTEEELHIFVDTLYQAISASGAEDLIAFTSDFKNNMLAVRKAIKGIDEESKKMIGKVVASMFKVTGQEIKKKEKKKKI